MVRLLAPYARCKIADRTFQTGDRLLRSVAVDLGEDKRASRCSFEVFDPELAIAAEFFAISFDQGGISVPSELLSDPQPPAALQQSQSATLSNASPGANAEEHIRLIIAECQKQGITEIPQLAYILATVQHETGATYQPIDEIGGANTRYAPYYGRGYVQLTWRTNYQKYSDLLGQDFVNNPDGVKDPNVSAYILVHGFRTGTFTGRKLTDYISGGTKDYINARRIINGTDRASLIAGYAVEWETKVQQYLTGTTASPPAITDAAEEKPKEISKKGTEIIVSLGFSPNALTSYHFIHIGTATQGLSPDTTKFEGQSIRWLMTRRQRNTTAESITLRELAQGICDRYGLQLQMEGDGPKFQHVDQSGITDYELLLRECKRIGYRITEDGATLKLEPFRPNFTGFLITREILIPGSLRFSDRASQDMPVMDGGAMTQPTTAAAEQTAEIDRESGAVTQVKEEDSTGTATAEDAPPDTAVTGAARTEAGATVAPASSGSDPVTGLPTQQVGLIDLADGRAEAEVIQDEARRVMGYESSAQILTTTDGLTLAPGSIIGISRDLVPEVFAREWRIHMVRHSWQLGQGMTTDVQFYSPQRAKPPSSTAGTSTGITSAPPTSNPGGFIMPIGGGRIGDGLGPRKSSIHRGLDVAAPGGTAIFASADGVVVKVQSGCPRGFIGNRCGGGWGNYVILQHADNIFTLYGHLSRIDVSEGQQVPQGQNVGACGSSGNSSGDHLHFECRRGGAPPSGEAIPPSTLGITYDGLTGSKRAGFQY